MKYPDHEIRRHEMKNSRSLIRFIKNQKDLAVIIVNMQPNTDISFWLEYNAPEIKRYLVKNHIQILRLCEKRDIPVIILEDDELTHEETLPEIIQSSKKVKRLVVMEKYSSDGFSNTTLNKKLLEWNVKTLLITGTLGGSCVFATTQSALRKGYRVASSDSVIENDAPTWDHMEWFRKNTLFFEGESLAKKFCTLFARFAPR